MIFSLLIIHIFSGDAGYSDPTAPAGDVIFVIESKENNVFRRTNIDLVVEKKATLVEALCGGTFVIKHLDDRIIKFSIQRGETIQPDSWFCIKDEGMPVHGRPHVHGNLYVHFDVEFPVNLSETVVAKLLDTLGPLPNVEEANDNEVTETEMAKVVNIQVNDF